MTKLYSVFDSKTETYYYPMRAFNSGHFLRETMDLLKDEQHQFAKHPEDYTIFEIGEWDEEKGLVNMYQSKRPLGCLIELKPQSGAN